MVVTNYMEFMQYVMIILIDITKENNTWSSKEQMMISESLSMISVLISVLNQLDSLHPIELDKDILNWFKKINNKFITKEMK